MTEVGASAFKTCKAATSVTVGVNVESIGKQAFSGCAKLKKVTVNSKALKKIGAKAFYKCRSLGSISFKGTKAPKAGSQAFKGIKAGCRVTAAKKISLAQLKKCMKSAGRKVVYIVYKK